MSTRPSKLSTDIDFSKPGRQIGSLRSPHSTNASGWGTLLMPIACIGDGNGPTVLFTGANHGDEYEGPLALLDLVSTLDAEKVRGRIIVLPALNYPALMAGTRLSPIDGVNMNRAFPGQRDGTLTRMIADYVTRNLLPLADIVVDLHSGGGSMIFAPSVVMHRLDDADREARTLAAIKAFGAPFAMVLTELDSGGMLDSTVEDMGKIFISTELGGGAFVSPASARVARRGVRNLLCHFGLLDEPVRDPSADGDPASRVIDVPDEGFAMAFGDGLYEPFVEVGEPVHAGQALGQAYHPDRLGEAATVIACPCDGVLVTRAGRGWIKRGDTVAVVGRDL